LPLPEQINFGKTSFVFETAGAMDLQICWAFRK